MEMVHEKKHRLAVVLDEPADLVTHRAAQRLSIRALAEIADVAPGTVWRIEKGKVPTQRVREKLAAALQVAPEFVLVPEHAPEGNDGEPDSLPPARTDSREPVGGVA
jgi:transcriptional regulator with XRE-family HTH domain